MQSQPQLSRSCLHWLPATEDSVQRDDEVSRRGPDHVYFQTRSMVLPPAETRPSHGRSIREDDVWSPHIGLSMETSSLYRSVAAMTSARGTMSTRLKQSKPYIEHLRRHICHNSGRWVMWLCLIRSNNDANFFRPHDQSKGLSYSHRLHIGQWTLMGRDLGELAYTVKLRKILV